MTEKIKFSAKEVLETGSIFCVAFGLSLLANPDLIFHFLRNDLRGPFENMRINGSEKEELNIMIECIPEGEEQKVAQQINNACKADKRRKTKPHLMIFKALRQIAQRHKYYPSNLPDDN